MLSNQNFDMPHLWGGWIISPKEKCSLTQISTDLLTIFVILFSVDIYIYIYIYTEQNYKRNTFVFAPIFHELNSKI